MGDTPSLLHPQLWPLAMTFTISSSRREWYSTKRIIFLIDGQGFVNAANKKALSSTGITKDIIHVKEGFLVQVDLKEIKEGPRSSS